MAATCQRILRSKLIIQYSACTYNRTILNCSNCGRFWTGNFSSKPADGRNENGSSDSETLDPKQKTDHTDKQNTDLTDELTKAKSIWLQPIPEEYRGDHLPNPVRNTEREYFQSVLDPKSKSKYYSRKLGISKDVYDLLFFNMNINDDDEINHILRQLKFIKHKKDQRYIEGQLKRLGPELGAAYFIIPRGGAVKFVGKNHWFTKSPNNDYLIPAVVMDNLYVEAIDASDMKLTHVGFDHLEPLSKLRYLKFKDCPYIDDWCLSRLQQHRQSLEFLDISGCPGITDHGLSILHCLQNLKVLRLSNLENVKHLGLLTLLLEEKIPGLQIHGVKDEELKPPSWDHRGESRLVRALLGYTNDVHDEAIGKVEEIPLGEDISEETINKTVIKRVE